MRAAVRSGFNAATAHQWWSIGDPFRKAYALARSFALPPGPITSRNA